MEANDPQVEWIHVLYVGGPRDGERLAYREKELAARMVVTVTTMHTASMGCEQVEYRLVFHGGDHPRYFYVPKDVPDLMAKLADGYKGEVRSWPK
jgi:hypothetical protein